MQKIYFLKKYSRLINKFVELLKIQYIPPPKKKTRLSVSGHGWLTVNVNMFSNTPIICLEIEITVKDEISEGR